MQFKLAIVLFLFLDWFSTPEKVHNKLQKLYEKNTDKCEQLAKKYSTHKTKQVEAFYFLSKIYFDNYKAARKDASKFTNLTKALQYAAKMQKLDSTLLFDKSGWENLARQLNAESSAYIEVLRQNELEDKANTLAIRLQKFNGIKVEANKEPKVRAEEETPESKVVDKLTRFTNGQFFGMPSGLEQVPSFSVDQEKELVAILNKARLEKGMVALQWDEDLARAARYHAADLATQDYFDHNTYDLIDGKLVQVGGTFERIKKFYKKGFVNSENIAAGNSTAEGTYSQWFHSPGHYRNMFNAGSTKVGIGLFYSEESSYGYYWAFCTALD